jgi:hypothetical protein
MCKSRARRKSLGCTFSVLHGPATKTAALAANLNDTPDNLFVTIMNSGKGT